MAEDGKPPVTVNIGATAKLEIKTEIPAESSGKALDAIVDVFRPFTEARGLKADQIRLQREDVLIEIARRAKQRLKIEGTTPRPVVAKTLIPLIEKASLEEPDDDEMLDRWAALLAAESGDPGPNRRWFVEALSSLNGWQARLLDQVAASKPAREFFRVENYTRISASQEFERTVELCSGMDDEKIHRLLSTMSGYTLFFNGANIPNTNEFELKDISDGAELLHLDALGLLWVNASSFVGKFDRHFILNAELSPLGFQFVELFADEDQ